MVRLVTPGGSAAAYVSVGEMVMPGVVAVEHGFGHTGLGASDVEIDGVRTPARKSVAAGINSSTGAARSTARACPPLAGRGAPAARQGIPARIEKV